MTSKDMISKELSPHKDASPASDTPDPDTSLNTAEMKAIQIRRTGGAEVLELVQLPKPQVSEGQVLLKVEAIGLNFADIMVVSGSYLVPTRTPLVPGLEVAGEIVHLGRGVEGFRVGQRVAALVGEGGFAEFVAAPVGALVAVPEGFSAKEAAAFPVSFFTAYLSLHTMGRARAGETVLVQAAGGALGTATVQVAKALGLSVVATASSAEKLALARELGAEHTVLWSPNTPLSSVIEEVKKATDGRGVDLICEVAGGEAFAQNLELLAPYGRILVIGAASGQAPSFNPLQLMYQNHSVTGVWLSKLAQDPRVMQEASTFLAELLASGRAKPVVGRSFPLTEVAEAFAFILSRQSSGKVILEP